ncbi:hypothetical protein HD553DRAFT_302536 [Filobasidium floriforme]|uniref:uncharacterized protein n=1 Tax=Filobasidium floriforme TaxID=5210 RepID=UPI001E8ED9D5|nr:uncharacterized protein HD553DRAFT_302536 [Filobasidium floriforme]KAH8090485.1 hypothetical protein HD553DRAFT_302536 [Filobasidium floriforme]
MSDLYLPRGEKSSRGNVSNGLTLGYLAELDDEACCGDEAANAKRCAITSECECVETTGNFYDRFGRLQLSVLPRNLPLVECGPLCLCSVENCYNRVTQGPTRLQLEVYFARDSVQKGFACRTLEPAKAGSFVALYAGELISGKTAQRRRTKRQQEHPSWGNYILALRENDKVWGRVDATHTGNVARFLNHSCDPNCLIQLVRWGPRAFPRPAIFTRKAVSAGEELTWDYGNASCDSEEEIYTSAEASPAILKPCLCGAQNCRDYLPWGTD